jgi:integrase
MEALQMPTQKLSEGSVSKIKVPTGKRDVQVFDDALPGFGVRKFASGKAFYFVKFTAAGKQRKKSLGRVVSGTLAETRNLAKDILAKARLGQDVVAEQRSARAAAARQAVTMGRLVESYLEDREGALRHSTHREFTRYLLRHSASLHPMACEAIRRAEIVGVIDTIAGARGKVAADRARGALSGFFAWAVDRGHIELNPVQGIGNRATGGGRTRLLSETELAAIWQAAGENDYGQILRLLILTGQRKTEIAALERSELDVGQAQISLPAARTKNGRPHLIPLSSAAMRILSVLADRRFNLFGGGAGGFVCWSKSKAALDERLSATMVHWVVHDIRRAFVSHVHERGFAQPHVVETIVNHVSGHRAGVAGVYNKAQYLAERRRALELWGQHIEALVAGRSAKVVALRSDLPEAIPA